MSVAWLLHSVAALHLEGLDKSSKNLGGACLVNAGVVLSDNITDELDNLGGKGGACSGIINIWLQIVLSDVPWGIASQV